MKKLIALCLCLVAVPLIGCASITDYITPATLPQDAMEFAGVTNAPSKLFGLYHTKAQLVTLAEDVDNGHRRNVFEFQQAADKEAFDYQIATDTTVTALKTANDLQSTYIDPLANKAAMGLSGLLGVGVGGLFIKRPTDKSRKDVAVDKADAKAKIIAAAHDDPANASKHI